ncbi:MAG: M23 family metallopeptidase [Fibrobacterota bacterium]
MEKVTILLPDISIRRATVRLTVPCVFLTLGMTLCCVLLVFAAKNIFLISQIVAVKGLGRFETLKSRHLGNELRFIHKTSTGFESDINAIFQFDDHIRLLYGLKPVHEDVREVGIGGPSAWEGNIRLLDDRREQEVGELKTRIDKMLRQTELELSSISETHRVVTATKKRLRHFPSVMPVFGRLTSLFGNRLHPVQHVYIDHTGIDIANEPWTPVYATADGIISFTDYMAGYGNLIILSHGYGYTSFYGHLKEFAVRQNQFVTRGELLGYLGSTDVTTGPHLHYEIRRNGKPVDPLDFVYPLSTVMN